MGLWNRVGKQAEQVSEAEAAFRRAVRDYLTRYLIREQEVMHKEGKILYGGKWLRWEEVEQWQRQAKKLDRAILFDILVLYVAVVGLVLLLCAVIWGFLIPTR